MIIDTLLAVSMFILSIGSVMVWQSNADATTTELNVWGYALMAGQTIPLIWRRKAPVTVLVVIILAFMLDRAINFPPSWAVIGISFAMYTIGTQLPPKR